MPPVGFWGSSTMSLGGGVLSFFTPAAALENDTLIAIIVAPAVPTTPDGWELSDSFAAGAPVSMALAVFRRRVAIGEPAVHAFSGLLYPGLPDAIGMCLLYRGMQAEAALVGAEHALVASSTTHTAPAVTLTTYSDADLLVFYARDAGGAAAATVPAVARQRGSTVHGAAGNGGGSLAVAEYLPEFAGATDPLSCTWSVAAAGIAAQVALAADPMISAPVLVADVPGAIGLPKVGV